MPLPYSTINATLLTTAKVLKEAAAASPIPFVQPLVSTALVLIEAAQVHFQSSCQVFCYSDVHDMYR
jgi:hypothetical protein